MKWVKRIAAGIGGLIVLFVLFVVVRFYVLLPASRPAPDVKAPTSPEALARGKYIVEHNAGCLACHSKIDESQPGDAVQVGTEGGGRDFGNLPGFPGHIRSPNITPDKEHGIGNWTDGEVLRALREGVDKNGRPLFPIMPYLHYANRFSDDDALAVVGYLRTLKPLPTDPGPMEVNFPVSMFSRAAPRPLAQPAGPEPTDPTARGKWLIEVGSCIECHTQMDKGQPIPGMEFAGGAKFPTPRGDLYTPNITSDQATGIGSYTDDDLMRVFSEGKGKDGRTLYVMPWSFLKGMTDEDKHALIAGLRAIPPKSNLVPPSTFKR